jgi:hypothetical protein
MIFSAAGRTRISSFSVHRPSRTESSYTAAKLGAILESYAVTHGRTRCSSTQGEIHTNTIEGFWSIFKRGIVGSFHKVSQNTCRLQADIPNVKEIYQELTEAAQECASTLEHYDDDDPMPSEVLTGIIRVQEAIANCTAALLLHHIKTKG